MKDQSAISENTKESCATLRNRRLTALAMSVAIVLVVGIIIGMMLAIHFAEPQASPDSEEMRVIQTTLARNPDNASVKDALREEDLRLRKQYSANRRRFQTGAWILLAGVVLATVSMKWYMALDPEATQPSMPRDRQNVDQWASRKKRAWLLSCAASAVLLIALLIIGTFGRVRSPFNMPSETPEPTIDHTSNTLPATDNSGDNPPPYDENWPWFRGPTTMGIAVSGDWPMTWDATTGENISWQVEIPIPGKSSPIVWGDRIFLSGATESKQELLCFDRTTGQQLWTTTIAPPRPAEHEYDIMEETGYAALTPATDGKHVYVMYASADIAAVDFDGNVVWARNLGLPDSLYGLATSLLIHDGKVLVQFDRGSSVEDNLSALLALDVLTGKTVWSTPRPVDNGWTSPVLAHTEERIELITSGDPWVIAYNPNTGDELWRAAGLSGDVAPSPAYANGIVFVMNEYAKLMAIRTGGSGDVTDTHVLWTSEEGLSDAASPIAYGELLLQVNSSGQLTCFEAKTGEILWIENTQSEFWASPILAGETVYLCDYEGKTLLFNLNREYSLIGTPDIGEPISASPAFLDGQIFIRGMQHLFCIARQAKTK